MTRLGLLAMLAGALVAAGSGILTWFGIDPMRRLDLREPGYLAAEGYEPGQPVFLRIFKREGELELWHRRDDAGWSVAKIFPVCRWSGTLGPKLREGDGQSPEGFYEVSVEDLNPRSSYHLSFDLGFPNAFDRSHGRTGSYLMVHGACVSIGCYAMTDAGIEEIYGAVEASLRAAKGQSVMPVHIFPFRFGRDEPAPPNPGVAAFWTNLRIGHDRFERERHPFDVFTRDGLYAFEPGAGAVPVSRVGLKPAPSTG